MKALNAAAATASSMSASSSTTKGALPPSSSRTGLRWRAAISAIARPTRVDPVKFTRRTTGALISISTIVAASSGALVTTLTMPAPRPASRSTSPIRPWVTGHISDALSTTVLPHASGTAIARVPRMTGAFHGAMPSTTPAGCRSAMASSPGRSDGMTSPLICVVRAAASRSMLTARWTLNCAQPAVAPVSSAIAATKSPTRCSISTAALLSRARRSPGPVDDHPPQAAAAAHVAAWASATLAAGARLAVSPVSGLRRSNTAFPAAARRS